ncbi:MAG: protein translocase subunit SecF [Caulobacterales bacterium]
MAENTSKWWPLGRLIPKKTHFQFVGIAIPAAILSIVLCGVALTSLVLSMASFPRAHPYGLNFGVDFKGGNLIEIASKTPIDLDKARAALEGLNLGDVQAQDFGSPTQALVRFETPVGTNAAEVIEHAQDTLKSALGNIEIRRVESVGPKVSKELLTGGLLALGGAILMQLAYVWFRFEWQFGMGAVISLLHDVILTIGFFSLTKMEFTLTSIAALLTIIGYSMNDTVVVFDRFRENLRKYKKMSIRDIIDQSLNETLSRTIVTGMTALVALLGLAVYGGAALQPFAIVMIWGILIGTYSSIYVAAPTVLLWGVGSIRKTKAEKAAEDDAAARVRP